MFKRKTLCMLEYTQNIPEGCVNGYILGVGGLGLWMEVFTFQFILLYATWIFYYVHMLFI